MWRVRSLVTTLSPSANFIIVEQITLCQRVLVILYYVRHNDLPKISAIFGKLVRRSWGRDYSPDPLLST